jgi:hypothetical protein
MPPRTPSVLQALTRRLTTMARLQTGIKHRGRGAPGSASCQFGLTVEFCMSDPAYPESLCGVFSLLFRPPALACGAVFEFSQLNDGGARH